MNNNNSSFYNNEKVLGRFSRQSLLRYVLIACIITGILLGLINIPYGLDNPSLYVNFILSLGAIIGLVLNNKEKTELASMVVIISALSVIVTNMLLNEGLADPGLLAFPILLIMSSLFLGSNKVLILSFITIASLNIIGFLEIKGIVTVPVPVNSTRLLIFNVLLVLSGVLTYLVIKNNEENRSIIEQQNKHLMKLLDQKNMLMKEVYHRVKNNLFLVSGLLEFSADRISSEKDRKVFFACQKQVGTMSLLHEKLYDSSDIESIQFREFLSEFISQFKNTSLGSQDHVSFEINDFELSLKSEQAIPLAMILNEFITNSLKHAFNNVDRGIITIHINAVDGVTCKVYYCDNGQGFTPDKVSEKSIGLELIEAFTEQLDAQWNMTIENKFEYNLEFKILS